MRRKRSLLQVSTFPFLAVLLCAMGALILFLLVMDRRAKIVARNKAMKAVTIAQEQEQRIEAELAARRKQQHDQLADQQAKLLAEQNKLNADALALQAKLNTDEQSIAMLTQRLGAESQTAKHAQAKVEDYRRKLAESKEQTGRTHARLLHLTAELEKLENTLKQLKAINQRPTEVVALVPFRGVNADQRRPIYVECRSEAFIVQPGRLVLGASSTTPLDLRKAIETRLAQSESAYVLFLVRPEGIPLYYRAQAALEGLKVDFGYEFVDSDWVVELSAPEHVVTESPANPREPAPLFFGPMGKSVAGPTAPAMFPPVIVNAPAAPLPPSSTPATVSSLPANKPRSGPLIRLPGSTNQDAPPVPASPSPTAELSFRAAKPPPPPVGRLLGNRDLVFVLECTREGVLFQHTNELHAIDSLKHGALAAEIRRIIARKQASLQPGESPYQPSIRFRIHADGLRAYYFVYPLLEPLRIPMTRENVE